MKLLAVTARSATFALNNDSAYYAPSPFEVKLCGRVVREGEERNVFSLFNLSPDTEYVAEACGKKVTFRTAEENLFLSVKDFGAAGDGSHDDHSGIFGSIGLCRKGYNGIRTRGQLPFKADIPAQQHFSLSR